MNVLQDRLKRMCEYYSVEVAMNFQFLYFLLFSAPGEIAIGGAFFVI